MVYSVLHYSSLITSELMMYKTRKNQTPLIRAMPSTLYKFLRNKRCLKEFIKNVYKFRSSHIRVYFVPTFHEFRELRSSIAIDALFYWGSAPEGHTFWSRINAEYKSICTSHLDKRATFEDYVNYLNQLKLKKDEKNSIIKNSIIMGYSRDYDVNKYLL